MAAIKGISKTSLWSTWKIIRAELRKASIRDVIDFVDYDVDPNVWIQRLLDHISSGRYEPATPFRFTIGKSNGFSRTMTQPAIPDLVLYRTIADMVRLVERIRKYIDVPVRYKARLKPRYDPLAGTQYVDMRALLTVRLLKLARAPRGLSGGFLTGKPTCLGNPFLRTIAG
jgi:hypothetical protein